MSRLVLAWLALWIVAVPLIHIHPEADHRHGALGHAHGGTVHLAFSPNLPCEYASVGTRTDSHAEAASFLGSVGWGGHALNHLELTLSLMVSSPDRPAEEWTTTQGIGLVHVPRYSQYPRVTARNSFSVLPYRHYLASAVASRSPPSRFS